MHYRPEIDGLRAVAVIPVVLFHAGFSAFQGGYVGVDVFFVISGYLVTTLLLDDIEAGRFSIKGFYARRIRRLIPALLVVLAVTTIIAALFMMPTALREYGKFVTAAALFVSNFMLWRETDYFAPSTDFNPLLHTWSLAVEEQFYIVIPLLLAGARMWGARGRLMLLGGLALASLIACFMTYEISRTMAFYWPHTRAWELLAGALCAVLLRQWAGAGSGALATLGLGLILASVVWLSGETSVHPVWLFMPVGGTVLIILFARPGQWAYRALALRPMIGIGLISYSVYLWHQPLFAFTRIQSIHTPTPLIMLMVSAAAFALGYLTWRYVEQPCRKGAFAARLTDIRLLAMTAATAVLLTGAGAVFYVTDGLEERPTRSGQSFAALRITERYGFNHGLGPACNRGFTLDPACSSGPDSSGSAPSVLIWGDSYAAHIARSVALALPEGRAMRQMTLPLCGLTRFNAVRTDTKARSIRCRDNNAAMMGWIRSGESGIDTVVLSSIFAWTRMPHFDILRADGSWQAATPADGLKATRQAIADIRAQGIKVIIVSHPPSTGWDIGKCLGLQLRRTGVATGCGFAVKDMAHVAKTATDLLNQLGDIATVIPLDRMLCTAGQCMTSDNGTLLYRDAGHLSLEGSLWVGRHPEWVRLLRNAMADR